MSHLSAHSSTENTTLTLLLHIRKNIKHKLDSVNDMIHSNDQLMNHIYHYSSDKIANPLEEYSQLCCECNCSSEQLNKHFFLLTTYLHEINNQINTLCVHDWVTDYIDIDVEQTMEITYCSICEKNK